MTHNRPVLPRLRTGLLLLFFLCICLPSHGQTFYGPGGLFVHPSAFTPKAGEVGLHVSWGRQRLGANDAEYQPTSIAGGVTDRFALGAMTIYHREDGLKTHVHGGVFGKYQFLRPGGNRPALAIAGGYRHQDHLETNLAGVLSHHFRRDGRAVLTGHAGIKYGRTPHGEEGAAGFLGMEVPVADRVKLVGEISSRFSFEPSAASGVGVMWAAGSGVSVGVGWVNTGRSDDNRFFIGVGYPLGGLK